MQQSEKKTKIILWAVIAAAVIGCALWLLLPHGGTTDCTAEIWIDGKMVRSIYLPQAQDEDIPLTAYGKQVLLNHEFGYKTRYAHLNEVLVTPGEKVKRGQTIALTGNTGRSTGPHLHYEVIHKGVPVNPINYFNRDMTPEEYNDLMERMRETNFEVY